MDIKAIEAGTLLAELKNDGVRPDLIYADVMYADVEQSWLDYAFVTVRAGGYVVVQTDYRSVAQIKLKMDSLGEFLNWIIWPYDLGGRPKDAFGRKHDDILIYYRKGKRRTFNAKSVAVKKKVLINSDKKWKIPTDVWYDIGNFYTTSKERVKENGKNVPWQEPLALMERIILALTDKNDIVVDPMCGTGTTLVAAKQLGRRYIGGDISKSRVQMTRKRLNEL